MKSTFIVIGLSLWLGACAARRESRQTPEGGAPAGAEEVSGGSASWAEYYDSLYELKTHADIAIWGSVSNIAAEGGQLPENEIDVTVRDAVWQRDPNRAVPESVRFSQTPVGELDPDAHVGDETIVFLTEYEPGSYHVTGGPSGRFVVDHGDVTPVVSDGVQVPANVDVPAFRAMVASATQ